MNVDERLTALEARLQRAEDQLDIMRLLATYGPAADSGEGTAAADLWTAEGVYDPGGLNRMEGHDAIEAIYSSRQHLELISQGSGHLTMAPQITVDGDTARAVAYSLVCLRGDDGWLIWRAAANRWSLRRTDEGWRIVERINRTLDGSAESHDVLRTAVG
jgi:SnoaL-like domain